MATLIGLLASSGLRSGEVVRLDRSDVDLTNGALLVRKTKFRKDRLVPVHTTTQAALRHYARERDAAFPTPKDQGFFLSSRGNRLSATGLQNGFAEVRKLAGLDGGKPLIPKVLVADSFVILRRLEAVIPYCRRRFGDGISIEVAG